MNLQDKTPDWQTSPGVFFIFVGGAKEAQNFVDHHQLTHIHQIHLSISHSDTSWWDKKFFRRRKDGVMKFPFSHEEYIHQISLPLNPTLENKRNFLFNLDLLKEDSKGYIVIIPSSQVDELSFILDHLHKVVKPEDGLDLIVDGSKLSLTEWNEWHWRLNNPKNQALFFVQHRNLFIGLFILIWVIWPQFYHQTIAAEETIVADNKNKYYEYFNITEYHQLRRVLRSFLFQEGYAFHTSSDLKNALSKVSIELLDSTQLSKVDWDKKVLKQPIGHLRMNLIPDSLQLGPKLQGFEVKAYKKWVRLLSDSLAYPTDYFWEGDDTHRLHRGIDIAGRIDTRIHSPISGRAIIGESDRAGRFVAVVNKTKIVFFAHCDKYLFLDGEEVRSGDPVATVGLTGHTTGPHVHIGAGVLKKNGPHTLGRYKFEYQDPIVWMSELKN